MLKRLIRHLIHGAVDGGRPHGASLPEPQKAAPPERARLAFKEAIGQIERGQLDAAEKLLHEALDLDHSFAEAHFRLGWIYGQRGAPDDAADCHNLAVHFDPAHIPAHAALAALHSAQGRHAQAKEHHQRIIELSPEDAAAHTNLCLALHETADYERARHHGERAIALSPGLPEAHHNLGLVLRELGDPAQAVEHFQKALELKPRAEMVAGLAHASRDLGRLKEAIAAYDRALRLKPDLGDAAINRAYAYLLNEDYGIGWTQYEDRFSATATKVRPFGLPQWNGEALQGKTILVHAEQGLGDEILFASCLPDLAARADRVVLECSDRLESLFRRSFPEVIVHGGRKDDPIDWLARHAPVHFQLPIGSLPRWFRRDRAAFGRAGRYLMADARSVGEWRDRLGAKNQQVVGISWRGGGPRTRGRLRSVALELLNPLLEQDAVFVSLQHGAEARELEGARGHVRVFPGITEDPDALAALIVALDLVISVDNTTVQLAGALGHPVWVLLSASPEWRYGLRGETMPWYPSARLFRQGVNRRWEPVVEKVAAELAAWRGRRSAGNV
jgi:tetratricopeptide (TPR) repeat protein